jgi:hypothetical protein
MLRSVAAGVVVRQPQLLLPRAAVDADAVDGDAVRLTQLQHLPPAARLRLPAEAAGEPVVSRSKVCRS